jgi:hypothetical protein
MERQNMPPLPLRNGQTLHGSGSNYSYHTCTKPRVPRPELSVSLSLHDDSLLLKPVPTDDHIHCCIENKFDSKFGI